MAEERLRIARELHDVVAHSMSVIAVQSGVAAYLLDSQPERAREALELIAGTSRTGVGRAAPDARRAAPRHGVGRRADARAGPGRRRPSSPSS